MEESILELWKNKDIFQRSMQEREGGPEYVFFEGPPTANGRPGNKRCRNARLVASGYPFHYPTFRHGYSAVAAALTEEKKPHA